MGIAPVTNAEMGLTGTSRPSGTTSSPSLELREGGERLGDVAGRIVSEVFLTQLAIDRSSYLNAPGGWTPTLVEEGEEAEEFDIAAFLDFAGVVEEEEEEEE